MILTQRTRTRLLAVTIWLQWGLAYSQQVETSTAKPDVVKRISEFAEKMEIFPVDIIAFEGPLNESHISRWGERLEVTFDRYYSFFEFKEYVSGLSKKAFMDIVTSFESSTPKEKALILAAIYIFECKHRKHTDHNHIDAIRGIELLIPTQFENGPIISLDEWNEWFAIVKRYANNNTIAFPAFYADETELKMKWEADRLQAFKAFQQFGLLPHALEWELRQISDASVQHSVREIQSKLPQNEKTRLQALNEFLCLNYTAPPLDSSGSGMRAGNSSAKAKTLGDIAKQLIASRPREFDPGNVKR